MSPFIKFASILLLCSVTLLTFVNIVENNIINVTRYGSLPRPGLISTRKYFHNDTSDKTKRLLDLENFEYTIRPSTLVCNASTRLLTWIVTSYAGDAGPRSALRRAYSNDELRRLSVTRVFLLGLLDDTSQKKLGVIQAAIRNEADCFGDILQGNFYEAYRNLTYKHLMGLKWATAGCENVLYIMKQDDDIVVNLYEIIERLRLLSTTRAPAEILAGYVLSGTTPIREPANKWFVTRDEFDNNVYPDFLSGWLYVVSRDVATKLVQHSYYCKKYFWIDDVFLTGILRHELNIKLIDMRALYATDYRYLYCCIRGKEKNLKCDIAIAPNGGKLELLVQFKDFSAFCQNQCVSRRRELSVGRTCVVDYREESKGQMGSAKIEPVQIL